MSIGVVDPLNIRFVITFAYTNVLSNDSSTDVFKNRAFASVLNHFFDIHTCRVLIEKYRVA